MFLKILSILTIVLSISNVSFAAPIFDISRYKNTTQDIEHALADYSVKKDKNGFTRNTPYEEISLLDLEKSLPKKPINVGFDLDECLLDTVTMFYYFMHTYPGTDKCNFLKGNNHQLGVNAFLFHHSVNTHFTKYIRAKDIGLKLMALHVKRGDNIYFITSRVKPDGCHEQMTARIIELFNLDPKKTNDVIFSGAMYGGSFIYKGKTEEIKNRDIALFYGDSDYDITAGVQAGARAIRVKRSEFMVCDKENYNLGKFNEEVLEDSDH